MDPIQRIHEHLSGLRRRLDGTARAEAGWAVVAGLGSAALIGLSLASLLGSGPGRWGWAPIGVGLIGAAVAVAYLYMKPRRARAADEDLARWVEARLGGLDSGVITSVQAGRALDTGDLHLWPGFSAELAHATADHTARRLDAADTDALVDARRARGLRRVALVVVVAGALAAALSPQFFAEGLNHLTTSPVAVAAADDGVLDVDVAVGDLSLRLIYPAYLDLQPRDVPRSSGDVSAVTGTEVRLTGSALHPATAAVLELESDLDSRWPVELSDEGVVRGVLRVGQSDRYRFLLTGVDGTTIRETRWRTIEARPDITPDVRVLLPESDVEVNPSDQVSLLFEAVDDHGLDRVELVLRRDGAEPERRLVRSANGERTARGSEALAVAPLSLEPGEGVDLWFEATDLNTVGGPGVGRSAVRRVTMYSPDAEHEERLADLEKLLEQLVGALGERLESPIDGGQAAELPGYVAAQNRVSAVVGAALGSLSALVGAVNADSLASDSLRETLRDVLARLQDHHEQEAAHLRQAAGGIGLMRRPAELLAVLYQVNEEGTTELENGIWALKGELDRSREARLLDQGRELLEAQNDLLELLQKMKEGGDPSLAGDAEKKLDELMKNLQKMEREMGKLAERSPYENQNMPSDPSDKEMDVRSIRDRAEEIRKLIREGKIEEAMKLLEELNRDTQEMMAEMQSSFGEGQGMASATKKKLVKFNQELAEVADGQRGVEDETRAEERRQQAERRQELQEKLEQALGEALKDAKALEEKLEGAPEDALLPADKQALQELRHKAKELRESVERQELETAEDQAKKVAGECNGLGSEVGESESRELSPKKSKGMKQAMKGLGEGAGLAQRIAEKLGELREALSQPPESGAGEGMARLGQRQRQLQKEVEGLKEQLGELDGEMPGIGEQLGPSLEEAGQEMDAAGKRLGEQKPGEAGRHQREAMQRLQQAQQRLEKRIKQSQDDNGRDEGVGINNPRKKVAIPEAEDYRAPEAFRAELMKAMKERAPERFQKAIDRYYEELVK